VNIGIISTAGIGRGRVIPAIQATNDATALAISSRDESRAEDVAAEFGIPRAYGSYEALLDDQELDAVYNPLPNSLHAEWTKRAVDAGLDVLCEKPLTVDAEQAREVVDYCRERDQTLMEAFMFRYHPRTERALEITRSELGELRRVEAAFHFQLPEGYNIRLDPELAGGSLMDVGCYAVTTARIFLGEPTQAYAETVDRRDCGVDTGITGLLTFEDGATATIGAGFDESIQHYTVIGTEGHLRVENAFVPDGETRLEYTVGDRQVEERFEPVDQYRRQVEAFVEAAESGTAPRTDGEEAIRTMSVIDALYESVDRGEPVTVPSSL
jgi:predicted dehydrogenase